MKVDAPATFFNKSETLAVIGVSKNPKKFSRLVYENFKRKGYSVLPVNPHAHVIGDDICYTLASLPQTVSKAVIVTKPECTDDIIKELTKTSISSIWVQQMCNTPATKKIAEASNIFLITGKCAIMYTQPVNGLHAVHKRLAQLFNVY